MPLLILFWDAKKLGLAFILVAFGNIFEWLRVFCCSSGLCIGLRIMANGEKIISTFMDAGVPL